MPPHDNAVRLNSLASGHAPHRYRQEELVPLGYEFFSHSFANFDRMARVYANAGIDSRQISMPLDWYRQPRTFSERNDVYIECSLSILEEVAARCLDQAGLEPGEVGGLVVVSSTGLATPRWTHCSSIACACRRTSGACRSSVSAARAECWGWPVPARCAGPNPD